MMGELKPIYYKWSCRNNQKWDEDALLRTEMNPDRCIVLKGHKCVDATTLRDYWKKRNRFPKDPFTSGDIDPCDAEILKTETF